MGHISSLESSSEKIECRGDIVAEELMSQSDDRHSLEISFGEGIIDMRIRDILSEERALDIEKYILPRLERSIGCKNLRKEYLSRSYILSFTPTEESPSVGVDDDKLELTLKNLVKYENVITSQLKSKDYWLNIDLRRAILRRKYHHGITVRLAYFLQGDFDNAERKIRSEGMILFGYWQWKQYCGGQGNRYRTYFVTPEFGKSVLDMRGPFEFVGHPLYDDMWLNEIQYPPINY